MITLFHHAEFVKCLLPVQESGGRTSVTPAMLVDLVKSEPGTEDRFAKDHVHELISGKIYGRTVNSQVQNNDDRVTPGMIIAKLPSRIFSVLIAREPFLCPSE